MVSLRIPKYLKIHDIQSMLKYIFRNEKRPHFIQLRPKPSTVVLIKIKDIGEVKSEIGKTDDKIKDIGEVKSAIDEIGKTDDKIKDIGEVKSAIDEIGKTDDKIKDIGEVKSAIDKVKQMIKSRISLNLHWKLLFLT